MVSSLKALMNSRKFMLLLMDVVLSLVLYFVVKYVAPSIVEDIKFVIAALQPVFVILINAIAKEDAALKSSSNYFGSPHRDRPIVTTSTPLTIE